MKLLIKLVLVTFFLIPLAMAGEVYNSSEGILMCDPDPSSSSNVVCNYSGDGGVGDSCECGGVTGEIILLQIMDAKSRVPLSIEIEEVTEIKK